MRRLPVVTAALFAVCTAVAGRAAERLDIEPCAYRTAAEAAAAWTPVEGSSPAALSPERTPDGRTALAFRCDMGRLDQRAYWDRALRLDLSQYGRVSFWIKAVGDTSAIGGATLYFNAGAGWYGAGLGSPEANWKKVVLDRGHFGVEDSPEGWNAIRTIRLAFWKGQPKACTVYLGAMEATSSDVVVVRSARGEAARSESGRYAENMAKALDRAGIDSGTVDEADVQRGVLAGKRVAIFPLNPAPSDAAMDAVEAFVRAGGRIVVCYTLAPRMAKLLGVLDRGYVKPERPGQFSAIRFLPSAPAGCPVVARQGSWNIEHVEPAGPSARVIAEWRDASGRPAGYPAITLSDSGAYISHILLDDDSANKDRILRALLGHLWPGLWPSLARNAVTEAGAIGPRRHGFTEARAYAAASAKANGRMAAVSPELTKASRAFEQAAAYEKAGRYQEALEMASKAREGLLDAYVLAQKTRPGEFRAVWCHSAYGVAGMTWDQAIRRLKECGFTAIVPNMLWGGIADYPSQVLPVRDRVAIEGDQIALCLDACRKYGVQIHVWKVNWNLGGAPESFAARMRAEGRLQRSSRGAEEPWLCPSDPRNFELERDSMLEVARKYAVDGIHFDYIRYPDSAHCYCDACRKRFEESAGAAVHDWPRDVLKGGPNYAAYQDFRRSNITRLVKAVSEEAHRIRPHIKVSAAVFPDWPQCREDEGQDWGRWVREGWLDFVCPMDYTDSDGQFRTRVQVQRDAVAGRIPLYPGIGASAPGLPLAQVIDQINVTRQERAAGFIIFNYDGPVASEYLPALGKATTHR